MGPSYELDPGSQVSVPTFRVSGLRSRVLPTTWVLGLESRIPPKVPDLGSHFSKMPLISLMKFLKISSRMFSKNRTISWFLQAQWLYISLRSSQPKVLRKKIPVDVFLIRRKSMLKITKMEFDIPFKHIQGPFFAVFCCWEVISWIKNKKLFQNEHLIIQIMITMYG